MIFKVNAVGITDSLLIFLLFFMPFSMGAVHPWSLAVFTLTVALVFNLFFYSRVEVFGPLFRLWPVRLGLLFVFYISFQLIPLPQAILKHITPSIYWLYARYLPGYLQTWMCRSISIYSWATISDLIKIIAYGMVFLTVLGRLRLPTDTTPQEDPRFYLYTQFGCLTGVLAILLHSLVDFNLHITANAFYFTLLLALSAKLRFSDDRRSDLKFFSFMIHGIVAAGFCVALFGIVYKFTGIAGKIYWTILKPGGIFGPYINYDHFAGYMSMATSVAIGAFFGALSCSSFFDQKGLRYKILWFSTKQASGAIFYLFCSSVMVGALFMSTSRGGILSFSTSVLILFFVMLIRARQRARSRLALWIALILLLSGIILVWLGPEEWLGRMEHLRRMIRFVIHEPAVLDEIRPFIWKDTLKMIGDFPMTGVGLGCFCHLFPKYRTFSMDWGFLRYAHNDYLQLVAEMGFMGVVFILGLWFAFIKKYIEIVRKLR